MRRLIILLSFAAIACVPAAQASIAALPQLPVSYLTHADGKLKPLKAGVTYQASKLPLALRLTPPPGQIWSGAQWESSAHGDHNKKPPFFGWLGLSPDYGNSAPHGLVVIMTSYLRTPSVAATVRYLRTRGHGANYKATSPVKLAGFSGSQFDGEVVGAREHVFIPFTPQSNIARYYGDANYLEKGEAFRIIVLNVRNKTVVIFINTAALPAAQFPAFLTKANQILQSLKFPG